MKLNVADDPFMVAVRTALVGAVAVLIFAIAVVVVAAVR